MDVLFNRLPMAFIDPRAAGSQGSIAAIGDLARTMGPGDALLAKPDGHVVVVAHTGLDDLNSVADLWVAIPVDKTLHLRWHEIPGAEVPTDLPELSTWLFDEWEQIDRWVDAQRADGPSGTG